MSDSYSLTFILKIKSGVKIENSDIYNLFLEITREHSHYVFRDTSEFCGREFAEIYKPFYLIGRECKIYFYPWTVSPESPQLDVFGHAEVNNSFIVVYIFPSSVRIPEQNIIDELMPLLKVIYEHYRLTGTGYYWFDYGVLADFQQNDDVCTGCEPRLVEEYWTANLFSAEDVKKLGRDKLLKAPCERIEEWEDGAIFMMLHKNSFKATEDELVRLRAYLRT